MSSLHKLPSPDPSVQELEAFATEMAWETGRILLDHFQLPLEVEYKSPDRRHDPVTEADRKAEAYVRDAVAHRFPGHTMVGEEGAGQGSTASRWTWAVDPLDGTTNFINGFPIFSSSIALLADGIPWVCAIFVPWPLKSGGRVFHASAGSGSWEGESPLHVTQGELPTPHQLAYVPRSFDRMFHLHQPLLKGIGEVRVGGSIAYELAMVSCGIAQYGIFAKPHVWDVAAGILLVREAGGLILTRSKGQEGWYSFEAFTRTNSPGILSQEELRQWRAPIIAANPQRAQILANGIKPRQDRLRRWLRNFRH